MLLRSILFVPADQPRMIQKALTLPADAVVLDLEDGVAPTSKAVARQAVSELRSTAFPGPLLVRLNALDQGTLQIDAAAAAACKPWAVLLPKVETADEIRAFADALPAEIGLIPSIESAAGVLNGQALAAASDRVRAIAFGPEDYARDLSVDRSRNGVERQFAINWLVLIATARGIPLLDGPFGDFRDPDGLEADSARDRAVGVKGRFAIHPNQIETINRIFGASESEREWARRAVEIYETAIGAGRGAVSLDGQMIDVPVYRRALGILGR